MADILTTQLGSKPIYHRGIEIPGGSGLYEVIPPPADATKQIAITAWDWACPVGSSIRYRWVSGTKLLNITENTLANPTVVTVDDVTGFSSGTFAVQIRNSNSTPVINGPRTATYISDTTFSVPVNVTVAGTAGLVVIDANTVVGAPSSTNVPWVPGNGGAICALLPVGHGLYLEDTGGGTLQIAGSIVWIEQ